MLPFSEIRLPARLAFGSTGGIERRTEVAVLASGYETRATPWAHGRRRYSTAWMTWPNCSPSSRRGGDGFRAFG